jgi:two-component system, NtrC family, sensor kinase
LFHKTTNRLRSSYRDGIPMKEPSITPHDHDLWIFLDELRSSLRAVREEQNALRLSLRRTCELFKVLDGCIATLTHDGSRAEPISVIPRGGTWDLGLLSAFLQKLRADIPPNIIMAPVYRRGRLWAVLALRGQRKFELPSGYLALRRIAKLISESMEAIDWQRTIEVRSRIDRKILEQLRPQDLFYQILHGLRSLTRYDHSSALLICDRRENALELVAEQIAWQKGKSSQIGLKLPLSDDIWSVMRNEMVYGFDWRNGRWEEWSGGTSTPLAELLDYNKVVEGPTSHLRESSLLCAPLATRDGVLAVLKVAARYPGSFSRYEADLVQQFMPLAAVAIHNSQRTVTLEAKMLEAEKKHAVANLVRGVSHDVNNALGCVLPLVQQIVADVQSNRLQMDTLSHDVRQIEQSIQTCRRIFGGMLALARGSTQGSAQANVRRALDSALAVLRDGLERQGIKLDVQLGDVVPRIQVGQGDLEQLFLNLTTNARDAMPSGGVLSIKARILGSTLELAIRDTGCGITPELISRIQEPFFTTKPNGNGLGLSICRSIIRNVGGRIEIESGVGVGTQIRVLLPTVFDKMASNTV